jgi:hypothetical protein
VEERESEREVLEEGNLQGERTLKFSPQAERVHPKKAILNPLEIELL